ncbi:hypothetical protein PVAG01_08469 [Phlyctema vagabunda]|uniref:Uncharacterized protein n=1 Tax=Phlyctema vagabunda TaxID=108571 RepID=A0ABR4P9L6_9HELO
MNSTSPNSATSSLLVAPPQSPSEVQTNSSMSLTVIIGLSIGGALALLSTLAFIFWLYLVRRRRQQVKVKATAEADTFSETALLYSRPASPSKHTSIASRKAEEWDRDATTRPSSCDSTDTIRPLFVYSAASVPKRDIPIILMPTSADDEDGDETDRDGDNNDSSMRVVVTPPTPVDGDTVALGSPSAARERVDAMWLRKIDKS